MILVLSAVSHLTCDMICPITCWCDNAGAVLCAGDTVTDIPKPLPVHTYTLQLSSTNMNVINELSLENMDLLLRFSLVKSHLHTIHPKAFHVAPQIKSVKLSSNDLSALPPGVFSPLTTLEQLHLDGNQLETISPGMLEGLDGLLHLDLSRNKLTSPSSEDFSGLTKLTFLNMGKNFIKKLPPNIFHSLTDLQKLAIYYNEIEELDAGMFDGLINLEELKLHHNQIASLPPGVFSSLRSLKILTLSSNQLLYVPEKSFYNMPKLTQLTLYNNPLLSLPDQLMGHMPDMEEFYLYATNLTTVPGNLFANMSGLLRLNFHLNDRLRELPSDLFCCLPNLQKLSLKSNDLQDLHPDLFSRLATLDILLLDHNRLQNLQENIFQGLGQLLILDLKNNHLKTLPGDIFLSNTVLKNLTMSDNPWDCTCSIRGIARWIRDNEHVVIDGGDVICHSPEYQMLRTLGSLQDEEFKICDATRVTTSCPPTQDEEHESTQQFQSTATDGETSAGTSTMKPYYPLTDSGSPQTTAPSTSSATITQPNEGVICTTESPSPPFYEKMVAEQGPEFVHHNRHKGWVYVWFLPSNSALSGFLVFCHVILVATGLFLILATIYGMYRLNRSMEVLKAEFAQMHG